MSSAPAAQSMPSRPMAADSNTIIDPHVVPAGCASCGGGLLGAPYGDGMINGMPGGCTGCGNGDCSSCDAGCASCCVPGRKKCCPCDDLCGAAKFCCRLRECICCPDPCYEPYWIAAANNAFFMDQVRPRTQMMLGYDAGLNMRNPDRAEYFWARRGGSTIGGATGGKGPPIATFPGAINLNYSDISLYTEAATDTFGLFIITPYRSIEFTDIGVAGTNHAANFGDLTIGTKSLIVDCELLQLGMQFKTTVPTGNFIKGIGNGLVSLEPSLLSSVKLSPLMYWQSQLAEWIPLGGDNDYQGSILHVHSGINRILYGKQSTMQLIGTAEYAFYYYQDGAFTDPFGMGVGTSGTVFNQVGAGLRLLVCEKFDVGFGAAFGIGSTSQVQANELYRFQARWRF
jgi:hypothetical protein